jgi:hypothetical protein
MLPLVVVVVLDQALQVRAVLVETAEVERVVAQPALLV